MGKEVKLKESIAMSSKIEELCHQKRHVLLMERLEVCKASFSQDIGLVLTIELEYIIS